MPSLATARTVAFYYALFALLISLVLAIGAVTAPDISWRRVAGHLALAVAIPLPPIATLWLGATFAKGDAAGRIVAAGTLGSAALPFLLVVPIMLSSEPLAWLGMLFVPPAQAVLGTLTLAAAWLAGRGRV